MDSYDRMATDEAVLVEAVARGYAALAGRA